MDDDKYVTRIECHELRQECPMTERIEDVKDWQKRMEDKQDAQTKKSAEISERIAHVEVLVPIVTAALTSLVVSIINRWSAIAAAAATK